MTGKNMNKVVAVAVFALVLSGFEFSQKGFSVVAVPGASPDTLISINNSGQVVVNTGNSNSYQVSTWSRSIGPQSIGLIGTNSGGAAISNSSNVVGAGDPDHSGNLQAFVSQSAGSV